MTSSRDTPAELDPARFRVQVMERAIDLFAENGYESTTVEQISTAAGVSRRTFFRQFRSKEDVVFADHELLLDEVRDFLERSTDDPWSATCQAARLVYRYFRDHRELAVRRYRVVQRVPALRDRELVTTYRYERVFTDHLRSALPDVPALDVVAFTAALTSTHNFVLRAMIRGDESATMEALDRALARVVARFAADRTAVSPSAGTAAHVTVVSYAPGTPIETVVDQVRSQLDGSAPH